MSSPLTVLGGISAEQFFAEYWQKKPLLVRQALPAIIDFLTPQEIKDLALEPHVSARLIQQLGPEHERWQVKSSPLNRKDFKHLPPYWTLLVQAIDQHSLDLAEMWKSFDFIPQWRRDDIMVSYAPQGGSVGRHFDYYDVFLVQGYGHRRWQLGNMCDENTPLVPKQPLKILQDMDVVFDEVLAPGDLLYVPPGLAHYGVAENDCLTFSFGFRMPNVADLVDRVSDQCAEQDQLKQPISDQSRRVSTHSGEITRPEFEQLKAQLIQAINDGSTFEHAVMALMSEPKYPDNIPESDELGIDDLTAVLNSGYILQLEPASRLLYLQEHDLAMFWANGESIEIPAALTTHLQALADGHVFEFDDRFADEESLETLVELLNDAILMLIEPAE